MFRSSKKSKKGQLELREYVLLCCGSILKYDKRQRRYTKFLAFNNTIDGELAKGIDLPHGLNGGNIKETWVKTFEVIIQEIATEDIKAPGSLIVAVEVGVDIEARGRDLRGLASPFAHHHFPELCRRSDLSWQTTSYLEISTQRSSKRALSLTHANHGYGLQLFSERLFGISRKRQCGIFIVFNNLRTMSRALSRRPIARRVDSVAVHPRHGDEGG